MLDLLFTRISDLFLGPKGRLRDAALGLCGSSLVYVGPSSQAPEARERVDCGGLIALPGLVDCHTHALFAGSRAADFERRLAGASYAEILEAGGGILSTVKTVRETSNLDLRLLLEARLRDMLLRGVTTVEVKSGYGLSAEHEHRMLRVMAEARTWVEVEPTFLGAHAIPLEHRGRREDYIRDVIEAQLPLCAPLARHVDVYCDRGAFTIEEAMRVLEAGRRHGLLPRIHAEQVTFTGSSGQAAALGATSADHLEHIDDACVAAMAEAGTVAVLLPGAMLFLGDPPPPVASFRAHRVPMAVASDLNPGSSPVRDLWLCATLACVSMGMRVDEALLSVTWNAARALARPDLGWLGSGSAADFALFEPPPGEPAELRVLVQYAGSHLARHVVKGGRLAVRDGRIQDILAH